MDALASHDLLLIGHRPTHAVGVHLGVLERLHHRLHVASLEALLLGDGAILVCEQEGLEVDDFFAKLGDLRSQGIVLTTEHFHLGLQVRQPLLLALTTFQSRNTRFINKLIKYK